MDHIHAHHSLGFLLDGRELWLWGTRDVGLRLEEADAVEQLGSGEEREGFLFEHVF